MSVNEPVDQSQLPEPGSDLDEPPGSLTASPQAPNAPADNENVSAGFSIDSCLLFAIFQAGPKGYFKARDLGVQSEHLLATEANVLRLIEHFVVQKGRLPTDEEILVATEVNFVVPDKPYDVELFAGKIIERTLRKEILDGVQKVAKQAYDAPKVARDDLVKLLKRTTFTIGQSSTYTDVATAQGVLGDYLKAKSRGDGLLGLSSPWPNVDKHSLGLQPGELTVILAKRKQGKCNSANTLCHDPRSGQERTIQELVKAGHGSVWTWSKSTGFTAVQPTAYIDCGEKECFKVTYRSGREMISASTHPFLTPTGWRRLDELQVGNHTAAARFVPAPLKPKSMSDDEIKLLAYMIADGGCTGRSTPRWSKLELALIDDFSQVLKAFTCVLTPCGQKKCDYYVVSALPNHENKVVDALKEFGLLGKKSIDKTIHKRIFSLPNEQLALFIGRLFSGDGSVEKRKTGSYMVSYSTGSRRMAEQLQHLLLRFGVQVRISPKPRVVTDKTTGAKVTQNYWELLFRQETIEAFKKHVGPYVIGPKKAKLDATSFEGLSRVGWLRIEELWSEIHAEMNARPELVAEVGRRLGYETFRFQKSHLIDYKSGRVRKRLFEVFCEVYDSPLKWTLDESIWWDEIESIEPAGKHHCYDLTVEPTHCYVANDYVVHNSFMLLKWMLHALHNDLAPGESILVASMEMSPALCYRRMAAIDLRLNYAALRSGRLTTDEEKKLYEWVERAKDVNQAKPTIHVFGPNTMRSVEDIAAKAAELRPRCVAIDGMYILGSGQKAGMWERTLETVTQIKLDLCSGLDMPVLATTQFKGSKDKNELSTSADDAAYAKAIGDWADAMRGLTSNSAMEAAGQRLFTGMESREFRAVDLLINFDLSTMNFDEMRVVDNSDPVFAGAGGPNGQKPAKGKPAAPPAPVVDYPAVIPGEDSDQEI